VTLAWLLAALVAATPLVDAVRQQDVAAVRAALKGGADVDAPAADGATALHWAVYQEQPEVVDVLLAAGARADVANELGVTPLHLAAAGGRADLVQRLLARGAKADPRSESGLTPLLEAARTGSAEIVRALLAKGADPNTREPWRGQTPLMWAAARGHAGVVRALLDAKADISPRTPVRRRIAMQDQGPSRAVKTSMQDAAEVEMGGMTALLFAAQGGDVESASMLVAAGADVNDTAASGMSALTLAAFSGHGDVARLLLQRGADPNAAKAGYTALHAAVVRSDLDTVQALLARGGDVNARTTGATIVRRFGSQWTLPRTLLGATPLFVAAMYLETDVVRTLLAAGADPSIGLQDGTTPLQVAAGAPVERNVRPIDLERHDLADNDFPEMVRPDDEVLATVRVLLDGKADVNQATTAGDTPLHYAAGSGSVPLIRLLAERGASLEAVNENGQTPLSRTLPQPPPPGRTQGFAGFKEAEAALRQLGATK
jgi:ankyrin repeat protein